MGPVLQPLPPAVGAAVGRLDGQSFDAGDGNSSYQICASAGSAVCLPSNRCELVSLRGFIATAPGYASQSGILDGASELLVAVLGEQGHHVRTAIGVASIPGNGLLELELTARGHQIER